MDYYGMIGVVAGMRGSLADDSGCDVRGAMGRGI